MSSGKGYGACGPGHSSARGPSSVLHPARMTIKALASKPAQMHRSVDLVSIAPPLPARVIHIFDRQSSQWFELSRMSHPSKLLAAIPAGLAANHEISFQAIDTNIQ